MFITKKHISRAHHASGHGCNSGAAVSGVDAAGDDSWRAKHRPKRRSAFGLPGNGPWRRRQHQDSAIEKYHVVAGDRPAANSISRRAACCRSIRGKITSRSSAIPTCVRPKHTIRTSSAATISARAPCS